MSEKLIKMFQRRKDKVRLLSFLVGNTFRLIAFAVFFQVMFCGCETGSKTKAPLVAKRKVKMVSLDRKRIINEADASFLQNMAESPKELSGYSYRSNARRDIFKNLLMGNRVIRKEVKRKLSPLEKYDISELKLVGVVWGAVGKRGIIRVGDGKVFNVKVGTQIGKNRGWVKKIEPGKMVIGETHYDFEGKESSKEVVLRIRPEEIEGRQ